MKTKPVNNGMVIEIWPVFSVIEAFEIVGIGFDVAGCAYIIGSVGPYLTREEATRDIANVTKDNLKKKQINFV